MIHAQGGKLVAAAVAVLLASSNGNAQQAASSTEGAAQPSLSSKLGMHVFPAKGQSITQQTHDENACFSWAKTNTGVDPFTLQAQASQPAPPPANSGPTGPVRTGSTVRGAAGGAAIGAVAGNAGAGAAAGAAFGAIRNRRAQKDVEAQQQAQHEAHSSAYSASLAQQRDSYNRAFTACLEGKGYTVK